MRYVVVLALMLLTATTALAVGFAQGQADPSGRVVLCTGHGPVMIYVDESGTPTGAPVLCPEGVGALFDVAGGSPAAGFAGETISQIVQTPPEALRYSDMPILGRARSPPVLA